MPGDRAKRQWKRRRGKETLKEKTVEKKRRTQLGIGSWTYPYHCGLGGLIRPELAVKQAMPPCELIEKAKKYNLHYVQICENSPLAHCLPQELADIRRKAEENGIKLEVGMRGAARGNLLRMIAIAEKLDAKLLRCVIDDNGYEPDLEEIIITLKSVLPVLEEKDIVLGIENHDRFKAEEFAYIMERLDSRRYGIVLDTTNSLSQEETVEEVLNWLAKYTVCLHFKDYTRVHGIILEGGTVVNIVPEKAVCRFNIRALDAGYLEEVIAVIDRCAKGAAICAGVEVEIKQDGYLIKDVRNNRELVTAVEKNMDLIGEHHIPRDLTQGIGSTDVGNVTQALPAAQFYIGVGEGLGTHTAAFAEAAGGEAGRRALTAAVKVLAMTGLDMMSGRS